MGVLSVGFSREFLGEGVSLFVNCFDDDVIPRCVLT